MINWFKKIVTDAVMSAVYKQRYAYYISDEHINSKGANRQLREAFFYRDYRIENQRREISRLIQENARLKKQCGELNFDKYLKDQVLGEAYQLIASIDALVPGLIDHSEKWLDNLSQGKIVHDNLLPIVLKETK